ncbi:hypothetical protein SODALDRAFT_382117 [Sodiomyces alkalinus F11]|uniref:Uncharacterized protein n=1 Tax=Sodiomyces alkalinus (strain CBS 110278 / VKM F-3762 / F11) TaxID=1314773 RepID=A0A3N2PLB2_SODAK|nr:hypothetical protein SODALDRAFT_382117 [Sodiomyces alkalinus F11]ROT35194.1 hypothetical protein SODALDRAFT_382117 [Sodiomyces alkalinus F11]
MKREKMILVALSRVLVCGMPMTRQMTSPQTRVFELDSDHTQILRNFWKPEQHRNTTTPNTIQYKSITGLTSVKPPADAPHSPPSLCPHKTQRRQDTFQYLFQSPPAQPPFPWFPLSPEIV